MENEAKLIVKLLNLNFQSTKPRTKKLKGKKKKKLKGPKYSITE